jgi:hypothetical protein
MDRNFHQHFKVVLGSNEWQLIAFIDESCFGKTFLKKNYVTRTDRLSQNIQIWKSVNQISHPVTILKITEASSTS